MPLDLDYYYGNEAEQYSFYRIPKTLFADSRFHGVSVEAKVLYGILLDRMALSVKNRWLDAEGRVYIIFTVSEVMETLACAEQKAVRLLGELDMAKGVGLIERRRRGLGKPNIIYVKNFVDKAQLPPVSPPEPQIPEDVSGIRPGDHAGRSPVPAKPQSGNCENHNPDLPKPQFQNCENHNSGTMKITIQELRKSQTNNTYLNHTEFSDTDPSIPSVYPDGTPAEDDSAAAADDGMDRTDQNPYKRPLKITVDYGVQQGRNDTMGDPTDNRHEPVPATRQITHSDKYHAYCEIVRENIEYDALLRERPYDRERLDGFVELMAEVLSSSRETVRINREEMSAEVVKGRLLKLDSGHISYVMDSLDRNTTSVGNVRAYVLSALFNAPVTIRQYYASLVQHDMANGFDRNGFAARGSGTEGFDSG